MMIHWLTTQVVLAVVVTTFAAQDSPPPATSSNKAETSVTIGGEKKVSSFRWPGPDVKNIMITTPSCPAAPIVTRPKDCADILASGVDVSGRPLHAIYPDGAGDPFFVSCDMDTDGGGWTVFQRRENGAVDFYLDWSTYKYGFGSVSSEHWLGNDKIHRLSTQKAYDLRIDLEDFTGQTRYAVYNLFSIGDESTNYSLTVSGYSGNAGDSLSLHSGQQFSTQDRDHDGRPTYSCAMTYQGAWWYAAPCHESNLNGLYLGGTTTHFASGVVWKGWLGHYYSLKKVEMKIRPL